jgi:hypothetical protein
MQLQLANNAPKGPCPPVGIQHEQYGPYFVYSGFRRRLDFGGPRSFELLISAFRDPRVTPERSRAMLNGIVLVWHGARHEIIVVEGHQCADRIHLEAPTQQQVLEFRRLRYSPWDELVRFCVRTPATRPRWRQQSTWLELGDTESGTHNVGTSSS